MNIERVIYICVVCFLLGVISWLVVRGGTVEPNSVAGIVVSPGQEDPFFGIATPDLTPQDVVAIQVRSIRAAVDNQERIYECFALASPSNREMTGPVERFREMVMTAPYSRLAFAPEWQVGTAEVEGDFAAVLVTANSDENSPSAFRFVLEKQSLPPYENCWMTVAVDFVEVLLEPAAVTSDSPE